MGVWFSYLVFVLFMIELMLSLIVLCLTYFNLNSFKLLLAWVIFSLLFSALQLWLFSVLLYFGLCDLFACLFIGICLVDGAYTA